VRVRNHRHSHHPVVLLSAIQALADESASPEIDGLVVLSSDGDAGGKPDATHLDSRVESYCEYFRRQLARIDCVEDAVAEMDSNKTL